ncbi:MAG: arylesterase [Pseudomarimonas sp.]
MSTRRLRSGLVLACLLLMSATLSAAEQRLLVIGDSLSAGYGLAIDQGWVSLLNHKLSKERPGWRVINASISGETTAGGASRIDAELKRHTPSVVLIELGANDGLRGLPLEVAEANLERMITAASIARARVGLVGIRIPPNYGPDYSGGFIRMYSELAERHRLPLLPFLLEPIATDRDAFQADNLHPTAEAQPRLLEHVWPLVTGLIDEQVTTAAE